MKFFLNLLLIIMILFQLFKLTTGLTTLADISPSLMEKVEYETILMDTIDYLLHKTDNTPCFPKNKLLVYYRFILSKISCIKRLSIDAYDSCLPPLRNMFVRFNHGRDTR